VWLSGSARLRAGMTDKTSKPSLAAIAVLRGHPQFQPAMRSDASGIVAFYRGNRVLNLLMSDRARALFTHGALFLHYSATDGGMPGLTVGIMKDLCVRLGLCSRGRCEATLALMRAAGFFAAAPSGDKRLRPLAPTEKLLALHRERWAAHLSAMRCVLADADRYRMALDNPTFFKGFALSLAEAFIGGLRLIEYAPELEIFVERNAGLVILLSLALASPADGPFPPAEPVPLSINALATTFSVSRKHVLTLLRDAEAQGLLVRGGSENDQITLLPRVRAALEMLFAAMFLLFAKSAEQALPQRAADAPRQAAALGRSA
jgi:hypothetical protein